MFSATFHNISVLPWPTFFVVEQFGVRGEKHQHTGSR